MPTDKLIEQRIREKNESLHSQEISDEQEKSTNKFSTSSAQQKRSLAGRQPQAQSGSRTRYSGNVKMRKDDLKLYDKFLEMLKQYTFEDGQSIIDRLQAQFREEYYADEEEEEADELEDEDNMDASDD